MSSRIRVLSLVEEQKNVCIKFIKDSCATKTVPILSLSCLSSIAININSVQFNTNYFKFYLKYYFKYNKAKAC